jgi:two-component system sensor histidine kinase KdpD
MARDEKLGGSAMKRSAIGTGAALASMALLTSLMLPFRSHLSIATTALILVVPVVIGVVIGGFFAGAVSVVAGFLVYDFFFIPPYLTLWVGDPQNWAALGVYAVVMLPVARVVDRMNVARANERRQTKEIRELFELSDLLVEDKPLDVLLAVIVTTLADTFGSRQVALFLPEGERLKIVASAGEPLSEEDLQRILPADGAAFSLDTHSVERSDVLVLALAAAGRPIGLLVLSAEAAARHEREPLLLFVNQIALAVERAQLRDEVLQARLTEEVARLAKTLVGAVSHDLRAPLASIKASSSVLSDGDLDIDPEARHILATTIDVQADRLAALVQNLLDMSRIQAGVLTPRLSIASPADLISAVVGDMTPLVGNYRVLVDVPPDLPPVDIDAALISRVLTNLLQNAIRHGPRGSPVAICAQIAREGTIEMSVTDHGPGVSPDRRNEIFQPFARRDEDAGAGLGLTIARTFVEAHGQRIWVEDAPDGGARFCFTLPIASSIPEEAPSGADSRY